MLNFLLALLLAAGATAKCFWSVPTLYTDGSPLPASDIDHYTLTWAPVSGQTGPAGSLNIPAGTLSAPVTVACGSTSFNVSVTTTATAKYPNVTSAPAGPVPFASGVSCAPQSPGNLTVQ